MDSVSPAVRSRVMAAIRSKDTKPEMVGRRAFHEAGLRTGCMLLAFPASPVCSFHPGASSSSSMAASGATVQDTERGA